MSDDFETKPPGGPKRLGGHGFEPIRGYRRPAALDQYVAESIPSMDPELRDDMAHTTARAILDKARASEDPAVVDRLVHLVELQGLATVAELWADATAVSLPGALWRLYVLREWVRRDPNAVDLRYRLGVNSSEYDEAVAGLPSPPTPEDLQALVDEVLSGVFSGDLSIALERAASFCKILAIGAAFNADSREATDPDAASTLTRGAAGLMRTSEELRESAGLWRRDALT
jgi:hypothetical protein